MSERFKDKVVLVTGAASGIGFAAAKAFAAEGARVALNDLPGEGLEKAISKLVFQGRRALSLPADVSKLEEVRMMMQKLTQEYSTIDILVNNAGVLRSSSIEEMTEEEWDLVLGVNLKGVFLCTKEALPVMKAKGWGRIVNISASAGRRPGEICGAHFTAAKAGVLGFTRHAARDYAGFGITVNAVCPGLIDTPTIREKVDAKRLDQVIGRIPLGRIGTPEEVAALILFLASDEARYITGATVDANGGSVMM
jgi:NAD(P)-dependent dehydrogenase (short-subunit alcohol dehydrogenase family)